eukprot:jgi/Psemu1/54207/gm1.54207_g
MGCNNSEEDNVDDNNNNNNYNDDELHVGMQYGYYYYKDGTQTAHPQTTTRANLENHPGMMLTTPAPGTASAVDQSLRRALWEYKGWTFHYQNWAPEEDTPTFSRTYTSSRDLFPQERKGKLAMAKLRKHGLQLGRVINSDALFFYQLLLPFHTDEEDEKQENKMQQKPFYFKVLKWSKNYANQSNNGKGHYIRRIKLSELVHFDVIVYLHGALEGKKGSICYRWTKVDALYSPKIATKMSWYQWRQIKSNLKLNCNHEAKYNRLLCKDDMSKFNYAYKFDYIYETLVHNVHYFSKKACSDLCTDELSWAYYGFGGPMVDYLKGKMFSRGGQTVILSDMDRVRPRGYLHRHRHYKKQPPHSTKGCSEVQDIFTKYVIREIGKLWSSPPHLTADNFFYGDLILDWMGGLGFGMIGTYFHKENVSSASAKRCLRIARLCNPVTMVKEVHAHAEAGRLTKSAISRSNIGYKSWKYHHVPINHAKALPVLIAFDMYQELTNGTHGPSWRLPKRQQLDFRQFKQKLTEQMLAYNSSDKAYRVDTLLREVTQYSTKQRLVWSDQRRSCSHFLGGIILNYHCLETVFECQLKGRLCLEFDTEEYQERHKSLRASKWRSRRNCYMSGAGCYTVCEKCVFGKKFVPLCKGDCFADYHSYKYFGLAKEGLGKVVYG